MDELAVRFEVVAGASTESIGWYRDEARALADAEHRAGADPAKKPVHVYRVEGPDAGGRRESSLIATFSG